MDCLLGGGRGYILGEEYLCVCGPLVGCLSAAFKGMLDEGRARATPILTQLWGTFWIRYVNIIVYFDWFLVMGIF